MTTYLVEMLIQCKLANTKLHTNVVRVSFLNLMYNCFSFFGFIFLSFYIKLHIYFFFHANH